MAAESQRKAAIEEKSMKWRESGSQRQRNQRNA
jgi:hypothetical protein